MGPAIFVEHLTKSYGSIQALRNVSLTVPPGQIVGLVGPNGAGKTTLMKAVIGALTPDQGTVRVLGLNPLTDRWPLRVKLGYMPQEPALYDDLSALENIVFYAKLHQVPPPRSRAQTLFTELDLIKRANSLVHTLSGGMQKRVSLACTLVHEPPLLILDEPTAALDPLLKRHLWARFKELVAGGRTLLISTHLIDEAMLCDAVGLMQHGRLVAYDAPRRLITRGQTKLYYRTADLTWTEQTTADGAAIATALRRHGLSPTINRLEVDAENLEDVMVGMLRSKSPH